MKGVVKGLNDKGLCGGSLYGVMKKGWVGGFVWGFTLWCDEEGLGRGVCVGVHFMV